MQDNTISVILPIKSLENFKPNLLDALRNQSYSSLELIIVDASKDGLNRNKINLLSAKSFLDSGDITKGIDKLLATINLVNDESAAEANYLLAKVFYSQSQKNQALETLYALNENFSNYDYWVGKSYLLIADIFISMNEGFQANATLESLIDNTDIDEIRIKALELKNNIDLNE